VVVQGEFVPQPVDQAREFLLSEGIPIPKRDVRQGQGAAERKRRYAPSAIDFMVPQGVENKAISEMVQSMAARPAST